MDELIPIEHRGDGTRAVSGRALHVFLEVATAYNVWFARMVGYDFVEGQDFQSVLIESSGGRPATDHAMSLDMAKEISMIQRTPQGKQARRYFIEVERRYQNGGAGTAVETREQRFAVAVLEAQALLEEKDAIIAAQKPKADFVDEFVDIEDCDTFRVASHKLGLRESELRSVLLARGWIYSKVHGSRRDKKTGHEYDVTGYYACSEKKHLFNVVPHYRVRRRPDGTVAHTLCINPAGLVAIARLLGRVPNHPELAA